MFMQQKYQKLAVARGDLDSEVCVDVMEWMFFSTESVLFYN